MFGGKGAPPGEKGNRHLILLLPDPAEEVAGKAEEDQGSRYEDASHDYSKTVMALESEVRIDGKEEVDEVGVGLPAEPAFRRREIQRRGVSTCYGTLLAVAARVRLGSRHIARNDTLFVVIMFPVLSH